MAGRYSVDDLLKLRASPLISKPANLPAIEDILSTSEATTKRPTTRGKPDDSTTQTEGFQKRPLLDSQRKSTTDPDRIVLGPPRRSFASSNARTAGKGSVDAPEDTPVPFKGAFDKFKNGEGLEGRRNNHTNGRYSSRNDQDTTDEKRQEDEDTRPRKDHDRKPRWAAGDEEQSHRNKFEQPWFRHDRGGDSLDETRKDGKYSDWRRDRGRDRGWDRPAPAEEDPEWMDEPLEEQAAPARTQEDFQRWKERMKAGKSTTASNDEAVMTPSSPEPTSGNSQKPTQAFLDAEADDSMDKFFARFKETKINTEPAATTKAPTKTRFASLFSPQAEQPPQLPQVSQSPARDASMRETPSMTPVETPSADADQAGFARILEMLQGRSQNAGSAQAQEAKARLPLYARDGQLKPDVEKPPPPPGLMTLLSQPQPQPAENQPLQKHDRGQESRSPNEHGHGRQQSNKNESLLNLLQQANQAPKPTPGSYLRDQYAGHSMYLNEDALNRNAMARNQMISPHQQSELPFLNRRENGRGMIDESPQYSMRYQEDQNAYEHLSRRLTGEAPRPGHDDQAVLSFLRSQAMNQQQKPNQPSQHQLQGPPPGLGRPPGLDQMPRAPPGWPNQPPQPHPQRQTAPPPHPPGMPNLPRNLPAQYGGPNMPPPQPHQRPQQPPPPPQQRKYTGESGMQNFPPMGPPPGFMNNGPPPGFPGAGYGRYQGPPEPPQGLGRAFMDMYGDGGRAGVRGGTAGGMHGYR